MRSQNAHADADSLSQTKQREINTSDLTADASTMAKLQTPYHW